MMSQDIRRTASLRDMQPNASGGQLGLVEIDGAIYALLKSLGHRCFHLLCLREVLLQARKARLPLGEFGVGNRNILNGRVPLVLALRFRSLYLGAGSLHELRLRGI